MSYKEGLNPPLDEAQIVFDLENSSGFGQLHSIRELKGLAKEHTKFFLAEHVDGERLFVKAVRRNPDIEEQIDRTAKFARFLSQSTHFAELRNFVVGKDYFLFVYPQYTGRTLADYLYDAIQDPSVDFSEGTLAFVIDRICTVLRELHSLRFTLAKDDTIGVKATHRDWTLVNMIVPSPGDVENFKVIDIDNSNVVMGEKGKSFGTLEYMAPESIRGELNDQLSEQISAATMVYELISKGKLPLGDRQPTSEMITQLEKDLVQRNVPDFDQKFALGITNLQKRRVYGMNEEDYVPLTSLKDVTVFLGRLREIDKVLKKAISDDRKKRYPSTYEFHVALRKALGL